jgi:hypothetical protein
LEELFFHLRAKGNEIGQHSSRDRTPVDHASGPKSAFIPPCSSLLDAIDLIRVLLPSPGGMKKVGSNVQFDTFAPASLRPAVARLMFWPLNMRPVLPLQTQVKP